GKCILAKYSREELFQVMKGCSFISYTENTITDMEALNKEIVSVRERGWGMDDEEFELGNRCIGAPIYDYRGDIIAAISASGTTRVLTKERIEEVSAYVMNIAKEISKEMGYSE
ncbi:MAG: IclR family transcriptional regulator C-terminal domain-containing protein, partial [Anaerovoracaceae bacterium]